MAIEQLRLGGLGIPESIWPWYGAYEYPTEQRAKLAWEDANRHLHGIGCWRSNAPMRPPHKHFIVTVLGEKEVDVARALNLLANHTHAKPFPVPIDLAMALTRRRWEMARQALEEGKSLHQEIRDTPRYLDKLGGMHEV